MSALLNAPLYGFTLVLPHFVQINEWLVNGRQILDNIHSWNSTGFRDTHFKDKNQSGSRASKYKKIKMQYEQYMQLLTRFVQLCQSKGHNLSCCSPARTLIQRAKQQKPCWNLQQSLCVRQSKGTTTLQKPIPLLLLIHEDSGREDKDTQHQPRTCPLVGFSG